MKRAISIYLVILLGLFFIFSLFDRKSEYIVEKKIWEIYKQQLDIAKDPNVIPDRSFDQVINAYKKIIQNYPHSRLIPELQIRVGEMYILRKDYEGARTAFYEIIKSYPENKEIAAKALFKVGGTYETADDWPKAVEIYQKVIREYALTNVGLNAPIYVANHYRNQNDFQGAMNAYEFAIRHYSSIASTRANTGEGLSAMRHLANCFLDQNRWMEAINTLGAILENYSTSGYLKVQDVDMIIKTINITAAYQLKDYDVAISLYEEIIARNQAHPLKDYLDRVIDAFNQLKEKGVQVFDRK